MFETNVHNRERKSQNTIPTRHMQLSSSNDEFSGLRLVGPTDIYASMVTPCVPDHQVCGEDNYISRNWLSI